MRGGLEHKIIKFVEKGENNILFVRLPPGAGKTITGSKILFGRKDIFTIWLCPRHDNVEDILNHNQNVFHLKGRKLLCIRGEELDEFSSYYVNIEEFLCNNCEHHGKSSDCPYYEQFNELFKEGYSFVSVHHFLITEFISNYIKNRAEEEYKVLVIDENPLNNLSNETIIRYDDLAQLHKMIMDIELYDDEIPDMPYRTHYGMLFSICYALQRILKLKGDINGKKFIDIFNETAVIMKKFTPFSFKNVKWFVNNKRIVTGNHKLSVGYKKELSDRFLKGRKIKNIFDVVLQIARQCVNYEYEDDRNLMFYKTEHFEYFKGENRQVAEIHFKEITKNLPDVPIIIMDATGEKELYEQLFSRKVEVFDVNTEIKRDITQFMDGFYNISSLCRKETRNRLFDCIYHIVKYHIDRGEERVAIVIVKDYYGKLLSKYLLKRGIEEHQVHIDHYGNIKGTNIMEDDKTIILVGTPEPNIQDFPLNVACWYEGEKPISNERIKEPKDSPFYRHDYRYKDSRYQAHISSIREREIEQTIDRIRFLQNPDKKAYLLSMLPISFETKKTTINEFFKEIIPEAKMKGEIFQLEHESVYQMIKPLVKEGISWKSHYNRLRRRIPFNDNPKMLKRTFQTLQKLEFIETIDGTMKITQKGRGYVDDIDYKVKDLEKKLASI